jgi:hypothetical protein
MRIRADMHIHSCLSPCGDLSMSPSAIVEGAVKAGLDLIAITDHNAARNAPAVEILASRVKGLKCFFGLEATSREEAHCLCIFDNVASALDLGDRIYRTLPEFRFDPVRMGDQVWVDENDVIQGSLDRYLGTACAFSVSDLVGIVHSMGGLFIPAHVDREFCSLSSQLGFIPEEDFDAVEVYKAHIGKTDRPPIPGIERYTRITDSDSHLPSSIGTAWHEYDLPVENPREITLEMVRQRLRLGPVNLRTALSAGY